MMNSFKDSFKIEMRAMEDRMNSKIVESRSRPFSPASQQLLSSSSSNQVIQSATQSITVQSIEDKR